MSDSQLDLVDYLSKKDNDGYRSVSDCLRHLDLSRATFYRRVKSLDIQPHIINGKAFYDNAMVDKIRTGTISKGAISQQSDTVVTLLQEISDKLSQLIERIDQIPAQNPPKKSSKSSQVSNKVRAAESKQRVIDAYRKLEAEGRLPLHPNGHINQSEFAHITNIPRGTIGKYIKHCL